MAPGYAFLNNKQNQVCLFLSLFNRAPSAGAVEYTNCISAEEYNSPKECPDNDIKQSDVGALGSADYSFIAIALRSTLPRSGNTW